MYPQSLGGVGLVSLSQSVVCKLMIQQMGRYRVKELKVKLKKQEYKFMALQDLLERVILENNELKRRLK